MANVDPVRPLRTVHNGQLYRTEAQFAYRESWIFSLFSLSRIRRRVTLALRKYYFVRQKFRRALSVPSQRNDTPN